MNEALYILLVEDKLVDPTINTDSPSFCGVYFEVGPAEAQAAELNEKYADQHYYVITTMPDCVVIPLPPDTERCQGTYISNQPFRIGVPMARVRCPETPSHIVTEKARGEDGRRGSMSLCDNCLGEFQKVTNMNTIKMRQL